MLPTTDGDPPRQPPVVDDPVPPIPYTHAPDGPVHEDIPRHATTVCQRIAGILEDLIDQRLVVPDTQVHSSLQQCITLASGVTECDNVYVRSRSRKDGAERQGRGRRV